MSTLGYRHLSALIMSTLGYRHSSALIMVFCFGSYCFSPVISIKLTNMQVFLSRHLSYQFVSLFRTPLAWCMSMKLWAPNVKSASPGLLPRHCHGDPHMAKCNQPTNRSCRRWLSSDSRGIQSPLAWSSPRINHGRWLTRLCSKTGTNAAAAATVPDRHALQTTTGLMGRIYSDEFTSQRG